MLINTEIQALAQWVGDLLAQRNAKLALAESCTGGAVAAAITAIAGSSSWFELGLVTYSNGFKSRLLNVSEETIADHGVVSEPVVAQMLMGACELAGAEFGIAVSGIAGPGGGTPQKPVGTVCFAWGSPSQAALSTQHFSGDRDSIRKQSVLFVLEQLGKHIASI
ncbi:MAG TPA: CinA family protein [Marinagarivorans sp.]